MKHAAIIIESDLSNRKHDLLKKATLFLFVWLYQILWWWPGDGIWFDTRYISNRSLKIRGDQNLRYQNPQFGRQKLYALLSKERFKSPKQLSILFVRRTGFFRSA